MTFVLLCIKIAEGNYGHFPLVKSCRGDLNLHLVIQQTCIYLFAEADTLLCIYHVDQRVVNLEVKGWRGILVEGADYCIVC